MYCQVGQYFNNMASLITRSRLLLKLQLTIPAWEKLNINPFKI